MIVALIVIFVVAVSIYMFVKRNSSHEVPHSDSSDEAVEGKQEILPVTRAAPPEKGIPANEIDHEKFSELWDVRRLISEYARNKGEFMDDSPSEYGELITKQIQSVVSAYVPESGVMDYSCKSFAFRFERGEYLGDTMSTEQKEEFKALMKDCGPADEYIRQGLESLDEYLDSKSSRACMFDIFIDYIIGVQKLLDIHNCILECNRAYSLAIFKTKSMTEDNLRDTREKLYRMTSLLLGTDYERVIPEWELIEGHGYPAYTHAEMMDKYYDDF